MDGHKNVVQITTLKSRAVKIQIPACSEPTEIIVRRSKSGRTEKKTTIKVESQGQVSVVAIDE